MTFARRLMVAMLVVGLSVTAAHAAPISLNYDFTGSGFDFPNTPDPIVGSFSVTFDNAIGDIINETSNLSVTLNAPFDGPAMFTYAGGADILWIGAAPSGADGFGSLPANDFVLRINDASSATPSLLVLAYRYDDPAFPDLVLIDVAEFTTLTPSDAAPVPEPASLTLLGLGLAGIAGRRWRQRKRA